MRLIFFPCLRSYFSTKFSANSKISAVNELKHFIGYDDTLDVFGIYGIAGILRVIMTGIFATNIVNPIFKDTDGLTLPAGLIDGNVWQIVNQIVAVGVKILVAGIGSFLILKAVDFAIGLRVSEEHEIMGLDASQHGETAYVFAFASSEHNEIADASFENLSSIQTQN